MSAPDPLAVRFLSMMTNGLCEYGVKCADCLCSPADLIWHDGRADDFARAARDLIADEIEASIPDEGPESALIPDVERFKNGKRAAARIARGSTDG